MRRPYPGRFSVFVVPGALLKPYPTVASLLASPQGESVGWRRGRSSLSSPAFQPRLWAPLSGWSGLPKNPPSLNRLPHLAVQSLPPSAKGQWRSRHTGPVPGWVLEGGVGGE